MWAFRCAGWLGPCGEHQMTAPCFALVREAGTVGVVHRGVVTTGHVVGAVGCCTSARLAFHTVPPRHFMQTHTSVFLVSPPPPLTLPPPPPCCCSAARHRGGHQAAASWCAGYSLLHHELGDLCGGHSRGEWGGRKSPCGAPAWRRRWRERAAHLRACVSVCLSVRHGCARLCSATPPCLSMTSRVATCVLGAVVAALHPDPPAPFVAGQASVHVCVGVAISRACT